VDNETNAIMSRVILTPGQLRWGGSLGPTQWWTVPLSCTGGAGLGFREKHSIQTYILRAYVHINIDNNNNERDFLPREKI